MGKRQLFFCDLTKHELKEDDEMVILTLKRKDKKTSRTYEISSEAATKLEQQLVAGSEATLPKNWGFIKSDQDKPVLTIGDLEEDEVELKLNALREEGVEITPTITNTSNDCRHINKGSIQTTLKNKKRFIYRTCTECGIQVPEMTTQQRQNYLKSKLPSDINMKELDI